MNLNFSSITKLLLSMALLAMFATAAFGQETTGNIRGTVKDPNGGVVPNATVTATNNQRTFTTTTDSEGTYEIRQLPPGAYTVAVTSSGFAETKRTDVIVELGRTFQVNMDLTVAGTSANVNVTATEEPLVDVTSTKTATNVTQQRIDLLPKTLRFDSVITQAPGARPEPKSAGYQIDGASGSENTFVVDGLEVTRVDTGVLGLTKNIPFDFVKEVQIKSAGYEAEFGGATGGVINVATRSGGNEYHGEVRLDVSLDELNASDRPSRRFNRVLASANPRVAEYFANPDKKDDFRGLAPAFNLGGPILKNKLWFYGSYAPQFERTIRNLRLVNTGTFTPFIPTTTQPTVIRPITYTNKYDYMMGRIDYTPFSKLTINVTGINSPLKTSGPTALQAYETTTASLINDVRLPFKGGYTPANQVSGQATFTATSNLVLSMRLGRSYLNDKGGSYDVSVGPVYTISSICTPTIFGSSVTCPTGSTSTGNPGPIIANSATAFNKIIRSSYSFDANWTKRILGQQHSIKGGYQGNNLSQAIDSGAQGGSIQFFYGGSAPLAGSPHGTYGYYITNKTGLKGQTQSKNQGLYIQDSWQVHQRVTLNLGLRMEKEFVPSFPLDASGHPGLDVSQLGVDAHAPIKFGWSDKVAPRIGGAWDVRGDGKLKIFGSYSVFFDTMKYNLPLGSFGGDTWIKTTRALDTLDFRSISLANQPGTAFQVIDLRSPALLLLKNSAGAVYHPVDPNIKPIREHEYSVGAEYGIRRDMVISGRFTRKVLDRAIEDIGTMFITNGVSQEQYQIGNPGFGTAVTDFQALVGVPTAKAVRNYTAFELRLDKRFSNNYYFNASYTRSKLFGNYSGLASSDETGRAAPNTNRYFDMPWITYDAHGNLSNGLLPTDRPNTFKAFGSYRFNNSLFEKKIETEIGASQYIYQGTPLSTNVNVEIFSDNSTATPDDDLDNFVPIFPNGRGDLGRTPTYTQTDALFSTRVRLSERVSLRFQFNVLNLFNQDAVIDRSTALIRTSSGTASVANEYNGPAATSVYEGATFGAAIQGFIKNPGDFMTHFQFPSVSVPGGGTRAGTFADFKNPFYNLPITWQAPRSARFSIGVQF
ncbi:MAG TPA: TonB-dependent receptor [Pyrinomonadaceae bacterium]|nr:TonB-dependent receptor [Pyrinomonadaceae bacterium]